MSIMIIAEAGVNHNGSLVLAKQMVDAAKETGADYVKFQTFVPATLFSRYAKKADYQKTAEKQEESQLQMLAKIGKTKKKIVMSTGMCEMSEIQDAIEVLEENGADDITILHCNTEYPTTFEDVNLSAMAQMKNELKKPVGYSDHTKGIEVPIAAVALGAVVIEKHFTLDRGMDGPDHAASLEPQELKQMIHAIRNVEKSLGDGRKKRTVSEKKNCIAARKSIVARCPIKKGEVFTEENLTVKCPGNGVSPMKWTELLNTKAARDYDTDELI